MIALLGALLRTSLFLAAAAAVVQLLLRFVRPGSPRVHRIAWLLVLLQGWFWWHLSVAIPYYEPAVAEQASAAPLTPTVPQQPASEPISPAKEILAREYHPPILPRATPVLNRKHVASKAPRAVVPQAEATLASESKPEVRPAWTAAARRYWPIALLAAWATGALGLAGASLVGYLQFLRSLRSARPAGEIWAREWADLLARRGVRSAVPLSITANVGPLLCLGPRGYQLVVPAALWEQLSAAGRLSILRHELAHLERCDLLKSICVRLLMLPHWFNPLAWLAARRFDEAAEWACDEAAKGTDAEGRRDYAAALLQLDAACGPSPSYHAAASGRGLSLRIQRLLSPQVKEDSIMKKTMILAVASALTLVCFVRVNLVAKEPPGQVAQTPAKSAEKPIDEQPQVVPAAIPSADVLRYAPNDCQGIFWADVNALRKATPTWVKKSFGPGYGVKTDDIERVVIGFSAWPTPHDFDGAFAFCDLSRGVATISVSPRVTAAQLKEQVEKSLKSVVETSTPKERVQSVTPSSWRDETIRGTALHVQQSKEPIAFFQPSEHLLVIGPAKLVREVAARGAPVQLSGKLAAAWARVDRSHAVGLAAAPPPVGCPMRRFLPTSLCDGTEIILLDADVASGKDIQFRFSVPCNDAGVAWQIRGLCTFFCKAASNEKPHWDEASKSFRLAVNDRCFLWQGKLPTSVFEDDSKTKRAAVHHTFRDFMPDELCNGVKSVLFEGEVAPGKDFQFQLSVPCVDAGMANEVRGLCETFCKGMASQVPGDSQVVKTVETFRYTVKDHSFVCQGAVPASIFPGDAKMTLRSILPDEMCDGVEAVSFKADTIPGKDFHLRISFRCVDVGMAYQVRGLCATMCKIATSRSLENPFATAISKSSQFTVNGRLLVWQVTFPAAFFADPPGFINGPPTPTAQGSQTPPENPRQAVLRELSEMYVKGYQYGLRDPANQQGVGQRFLAKATERGSEFARDAKLNEAQRMFRDLSEVSDQGFLQAAGWQDLSAAQKADEARWLKQLSSENESARSLAILALTALHSKKAVPAILKIAADRKEKDNADRQHACRALGIIGDMSVVPDLVHLTYHYDRDTRFWAQISLVRLTGENFARDVAAWTEWWQKQGRKPPISKTRVAWATSAETVKSADPRAMEAADRQMLDMAKRLSAP
jgi:beta-lactamase regulating signal transducer with metallopeptidase domain